LHYSATNDLAAVDANVDEVLKSERKKAGGVLVERFWDQGRDWFRGMVVWQ
jgi:hypothetical protein